ncbi:CLUMA_CG006946, isoform A [Clunio marinus]|uniref:CLUMA_CG006946, isoform A n=1 Tax=Clunio marinus TaxID=568069 RepID=A0A1J1I0X1_9DIPT|nr:CLUMA_CG006946, isoform A [Clunio marinus]
MKIAPSVTTKEHPRLKSYSAHLNSKPQTIRELTRNGMKEIVVKIERNVNASQEAAMKEFVNHLPLFFKNKDAFIVSSTPFETTLKH